MSITIIGVQRYAISPQYSVKAAGTMSTDPSILPFLRILWRALMQALMASSMKRPEVLGLVSTGTAALHVIVELHLHIMGQPEFLDRIRRSLRVTRWNGFHCIGE